MSRDIRSFFSVGPKKPTASATSRTENSTKKITKQIILSSDEEDNNNKISKLSSSQKKDKLNTSKKIISDDDEDHDIKPQKASEKKRKHSSKRRIESDDEDEFLQSKHNPKKKTNLSKLSSLGSSGEDKSKKKTVDINELFGQEVHRVEKKKIIKKENSIKIESDEELDKSLLACVTDIPTTPKNSSIKSDTVKSEKDIKNSKTTPEKSNISSTNSAKTKLNLSENLISDEDEDVEIKRPKSSEKKKSNISKRRISSDNEEKTQDKKIEKSELNGNKDSKISPTKETKPIKEESHSNNIIESKKSIKDVIDLNDSGIIGESPNSTTHSRKRPAPKSSHNTSTAQDDEDRHEKKRLALILYQKFKNRSSVINAGSKPLPKGKPNCLAGKTFVITGILESLERDEAKNLIEEYGGKVSQSISKKTSFVIVGEDAGPKKLGKAAELNVKTITEDDLFKIINDTLGNENNVSTVKKVNDMKKTPIKMKSENSSQIPTETKVIKKEIPQENIVEKNKNNDDNTATISSPPKQNLDLLPWVDKYKPTATNQIVGQQGAASNCVKLKNWLQKWHSNHDGSKKLQKPNPWMKNDDGSYYKAALLSGPPGIGKTTTVNLVCKELGYDMIEFNASDTRSKKLLKEEVSELLSNKSIFGFCHGEKQGFTKKHVLVMDEVDGMAGNEDRGGLQELIALIKDASVPVICMCNDRNHQKMRSLVNYCYDLRFHKPRLEQVKAAMMSVLFKEKFKVSSNILTEIIASTNNDIRQTLNYLSLLSSKKDLDESTFNSESTKKDLKIGPWDVVRKVFSAEDHKKMSIYDKSDLFFHDYSLGPLFVQQNYLSVSPHCPKSQVLEAVANTADSLAIGDLIEKRIRSNNAWSLLPAQAMFSSVLPGEYMKGHFTGQINFPAWLGKNSKTMKRKRLAQECHDHTRIKTSASASSFRLDYAPILLEAIVRPLKLKGLDGVNESINIIKEYRLLREDLDSLVELSTWPKKKNPFDGIESKVKAALTRTYNKEICPYSYSVTSAIKKKKSEKFEEDLEYGLDNEEDGKNAEDSDDNKEDDDLNNDALIKTKKPPTAAKKQIKDISKPKASTSKKPKKK